MSGLGALFRHMGRDDKLVFKRGATTGGTVGKVNGIMQMTAMKSCQSYVALSCTRGAMASPGDSGAWLLDVEGDVFGIINGGDTRYGIASVIPTDVVFRDNERITGFIAELI